MNKAPRIKIADTAGFCFGVKRAVKLAHEAPEKYPDRQISTLGPIIHNPQVVNQLSALGVKPTDLNRAPDPGVVIIRSHGITRELAQELKQRPDLTLVDATCPFIRRAQEIVAEMSDAGYQVIIIGEPDHPEVAGLISYGDPQNTRVVTAIADIPAEFFTSRRPARIALLAQTTQSQQLYNEIASSLLTIKGELRCFNTICTATSNRQSEALQLAKECDCMLIIGGRNSANTNRLYELSQERQPDSYHIETLDELQPEWFTGKQTIGISAGASTPQWLIDEVVERLKHILDN
jgi:4-hydroxy-3-methylbut-2-enyl diphosphate reductase